jgi:hypothetical protein
MRDDLAVGVAMLTVRSPPPPWHQNAWDSPPAFGANRTVPDDRSTVNPAKAVSSA